MKMRTRWIFFSDSLDKGEEFAEILWVLFLAVAALFVGTGFVYASSALDLEAGTAPSNVYPVVFVLSMVALNLRGFAFLRCAAISFGLALVANAWLYPGAFWPPLQALFGYFVALRVFSSGPRARKNSNARPRA